MVPGVSVIGTPGIGGTQRFVSALSWNFSHNGSFVAIRFCFALSASLLVLISHVETSKGVSTDLALACKGQETLSLALTVMFWV